MVSVSSQRRKVRSASSPERISSRKPPSSSKTVRRKAAFAVFGKPHSPYWRVSSWLISLRRCE